MFAIAVVGVSTVSFCMPVPFAIVFLASPTFVFLTMYAIWGWWCSLFVPSMRLQPAHRDAAGREGYGSSGIFFFECQLDGRVGWGGLDSKLLNIYSLLNNT
jgi:hypothetical protein